MAGEQDQANSTAVSEEQSQVVLQDGAQPAPAADIAAPVKDPRIEALELEVKALKGRLTTRVPDEELAGIRQELRRMRREIIQRDPEMDEQAKSAEISKLGVQEQQESAIAAFVAHETKLRAKMNKKLAQAGLDASHPTLTELSQRWQVAKTAEECDEVYDAFIDFLDEEKDTRLQAAIKAAEKKAQTAEQRFKQENGTLDVAVPGGVPAGSVNVTKPIFDPRGGHIKQLKEWERQQAARVRS